MIKTLILIMFVLLLAIPLNAYALTNSTISCIDAYTLQENITVYIGDNVTTVSLPVRCPYGCDSVTLSCSPDPFSQDLIVVAFLVAFVILILYLLKVKL